MTLTFPNSIRSFDRARHGVVFYGQDGISEIRFIVEAAALTNKTYRRTSMSEAHCLSTFDAIRASVHDVAREVYFNDRRSSKTLTSADFR